MHMVPAVYLHAACRPRQASRRSRGALRSSCRCGRCGAAWGRCTRLQAAALRPQPLLRPLRDRHCACFARVLAAGHGCQHSSGTYLHTCGTLVSRTRTRMHAHMHAHTHARGTYLATLPVTIHHHLSFNAALHCGGMPHASHRTGHGLERVPGGGGRCGEHPDAAGLGAGCCDRGAGLGSAAPWAGGAVPLPGHGGSVPGSTAGTAAVSAWGQQHGYPSSALAFPCA